MKKFRIIATQLNYYDLEIEAENEDMAWEMALDNGTGEFRPMEKMGDWEVCSVEEITNANK